MGTEEGKEKRERCEDVKGKGGQEKEKGKM